MARIHSTAFPSHPDDSSDKMMENVLYGKDLISIQDLSLEDIRLVLETAKKFKTQTIQASSILKNKIIAHCFFEPSTRTRLSFESACLRLGGNIIGFANAEGLSIQKGESLSDTLRMVADYSDLIVLRHPNEGSARLAADISSKPVINAGDGSNQHPSQALTDLFTIQESQQSLEKLSIALVGDLKYSRTIHSLVQACAHFDMRLFLVGQESLGLPDTLCDTLKNNGIRFSLHRSIEEVMPKLDILYMTRLQKERFNTAELNYYKKSISLHPAMLAQAKPNLRILHPLPRNDEIDTAVDKTHFADYFNQAANGLYVRQALLSLTLSRSVL